MENISDNKKFLGLAGKRHAMSDQLEFEIRFKLDNRYILNIEFR